MKRDNKLYYSTAVDECVLSCFRFDMSLPELPLNMQSLRLSAHLLMICRNTYFKQSWNKICLGIFIASSKWCAFIYGWKLGAQIIESVLSNISSSWDRVRCKSFLLNFVCLCNNNGKVINLILAHEYSLFCLRFLRTPLEAWQT